ncbi:MAG: glutamate synthase large subunit [Clostridia bacterium]|nr:glutamate synthase large subunit [Clostridia bacterium]NCC75870.1 glutamate synthase large subunit [Clostridia bacterium]
MQHQNLGLPQRQGLYDPQFEHDACGIGFVVNIKGQRSHSIVRQALTVLSNLAHRGGAGSEDNTGDGAGILLQIPDKFFRSVCPQVGIELPPEGHYGVGMAFLPLERNERKGVQARIETIVREEGQTVLGWRYLPVNESSLGYTARINRPHISQLFIGAAEGLDPLAFERSLYVIRKRCEKLVVGKGEADRDYFYFASLSSRTIVYKGMLTAEQVDAFYLDLANLNFESAIALVHSRYSTNTFPSWERAHPYRYLIHNGEINTLRGNINRMNAREPGLSSTVFGGELDRIFPIINNNGSDSAMFDNTLEFLVLSGRSIAHAGMMMVPEPWQNHESMSDTKRAFYEYHAMMMEPWDGPAAMAFTDGTRVAAILDRNGLRPSRYYVTKDDLIILASEAGVLDIPPENIVVKERLRPGRMLLIDTEEGRIISDAEIKEKIAGEKPYRTWIDQHMITLKDLPEATEEPLPPQDELEKLEKVFGYTYEDLKTIILPMARDGMEPTGAMGIDSPIAVLSERNQILYNYFKQLFAQVTNPPIDALREEIITATETYIGSIGNLIHPEPADARRLKLKYPILSNQELERIRQISEPGFKTATLPMFFAAGGDGRSLENAIEALFDAADQAIAQGANIIILSDRDVSAALTPIPALLATSALHHHLNRKGTRPKISLVVESGEPREVHHFALLLGYGASAVNPFLAFEAVDGLIRDGFLNDVSREDAIAHYIKASIKGIVKVLSKMGISTIQSYQGAQIFEAIGIHESVVNRYFTATASRIGGIGLEEIAREANERHKAAFDPNVVNPGLETGGDYHWRSNGEYHLFNPMTIHLLQQAVRTGDYATFKEYSRLLNLETQKRSTLRGLLDLVPARHPIPIEEVESVDSIVRRFKTGAMSYGSISQEAHEAMAIAMNRLGGRSNTGEGGENPARFKTLPTGDSKNSAIKQVASGRFGVTSEYLVNAREIQIKMAQGAKPGEGGQLPGKKVYPWVAATRHTTPGVGLISPPPHHDIYSIEDLAELIHDLKNANKYARINVKLVSEVGVGTIAAGVAKGRADVVLISGYDGGTGASPITSIRHAGLPWELGLAETHQTLMLNDLRSRIVVETDGKLLTGRDVVVAALLGAEEFGFATGPLVSLGCVMMRVCNLDTCPVGVATQNPELRKKFSGKPDYVVNFMRFIAQEMREIMSELGFRTIVEMVGRTDRLSPKKAVAHWKHSGLDLSCLLWQPQISESVGRSCTMKQDHGLEKTLDQQILIPFCRAAVENGRKIEATFPIRNVNRVVGTQLGSEVTRHHGAAGLPEDTISLHFRGSAGQSFGAFIPKGISLRLEGDANDYVGKGLSGGKIIVYPDAKAALVPEENIIIGNVALFGATSGEAYVRGVAGERFCVRNSGVNAVVEGVGDHGCEYMTGGRIVVLGPTGRNFAAGMSGGVAYVLDHDGSFAGNCNTQMVSLQQLVEASEIDEVKTMVERHAAYTGSEHAARLLRDWDHTVSCLVKVMPKDYERMQNAIKAVEASGLSGEEALMAAFEANNRDLSRASGN